MVSEAGRRAVARRPLVVAMVAATFEVGGLRVLGGEESEWLVSGVRPLISEAFLFCAKACEFELNTELSVLASELAEPTPRSVSPESDCCSSSESGERYTVVVRPSKLVPCERRELASEAVLLSLTVFGLAEGEERVCVKPASSRFRLRVPGDTLLLTASTPLLMCDIPSLTPQALLMSKMETRRSWRSRR